MRGVPQVNTPPGKPASTIASPFDEPGLRSKRPTIQKAPVLSSTLTTGVPNHTVPTGAGGAPRSVHDAPPLVEVPAPIRCLSVVSTRPWPSFQAASPTSPSIAIDAPLWTTPSNSSEG